MASRALSARELPVLSPGERLVVIGHEPIVLKNWVDPNQYWLPFNNIFIYVAVAAAEKDVGDLKMRLQQHREVLKKSRKTGTALTDVNAYVQPLAWHRYMYSYHPDLPQMPLRFTRNMAGDPAFQKLGVGAWKRLAHANFPAWDINPKTKQPWDVVVQASDIDEIDRWAEDGLVGQYFYAAHPSNETKKLMYCELEKDVIRAKLTWG